MQEEEKDSNNFQQFLFLVISFPDGGNTEEEANRTFVIGERIIIPLIERCNFHWDTSLFILPLALLSANREKWLTE